MITRRQVGGLAAASLFLCSWARAAERSSQDRLSQIVNDAIRPIMEEFKIPGMAVALTDQGRRSYYNFGVASKETAQKVTDDTLFEIGSISKMFTATLASYAQETGALSFSDSASRYIPALAGTAFDQISLLDLGTYVSGGLPLQFPDGVVDEQSMIAYYRNWRPAYVAGTHRIYSNPSIGLFGHLAATSLGKPFEDLMELMLFPALGLNRTYIRVPQDRMGGYAYGYSKDDKPIRVTPGIWDSEAYGVKTTSADLIRFAEANMNGSTLDKPIQRAIRATHTGYYKVGDMIQGLGWEMFAYPTDINRLIAGNSVQMMFKPNEVSRLDPPLPPQDSVLINKTGSTNGFGAYMAFVPAKGIAVVMLANRNYPIPARLKAAHRILTALEGHPE